MQQVQKEGADAAIHVEHQVGGLGQRVALHSQRIVQVARAGEELLRILLQQLHALVAVVLRAGMSPLCSAYFISKPTATSKKSKA